MIFLIFLDFLLILIILILFNFLLILLILFLVVLSGWIGIYGEISLFYQRVASECGISRLFIDLRVLIITAPLLLRFLRFNRCRRSPHPLRALLSLLRGVLSCIFPFLGGGLQRINAGVEVVGR